MFGYSNYYIFADNKRAALSKLHWILSDSLKKTICRKLDISKRTCFKLYGKVTRLVYDRNGERKSIDFGCPSLAHTPYTFLTKKKTHTDPSVISKWRLRSKNLLDQACANCGSYDKVEAHHLRHIRTISVKLSPFDKMMAAINRKQIPLCHECHKLVHRGKYPGMSLKHYKP
jgi:hypothetical protein